MTRLFNDPSQFADEALDGFAAAHRRWVRRVPGGVVRAAAHPSKGVAVVVGGGSGHYPAFSGLVGEGMAHGAVAGNVFASPSAGQICSVARAASGEGGVLLAFGNYAGDVLHFGQAREMLIGEGIACETVTVTDDVSSAGKAEISKRRGIAGDLAVIKIAAAAADAGQPLSEVTRLAQLANQRTRSFGVAFSGCTLPGSDAPLFEIPHGRMAVGLGIHGERGLGEQDVPSADKAAQLLVDTLMAELPDGVDNVEGQHVAAILNGLGAVKYEELFVVYRRVDQLLHEHQLVVVEPEVGEFVTSFDMAGLSLTLCWLDGELEVLWRAPADAPAYRKRVLQQPTGDAAPKASAEVVNETLPLAKATEASQQAARLVAVGLEVASRTVNDHVDELGRIDAVAGDGDHGIGMQRGAAASAAAATEAVLLGAGAGTLLRLAADAWADRGGGTSGALWGAALRGAGSLITDELMPDGDLVSRAVARALDEIVRLGGAKVGDKTMVDALAPFSETLSRDVADGVDLAAAWAHAAQVAQTAAEGTADLMPRVGRARAHAGHSLGTPDPGAVSLALIVDAVRERLLHRLGDSPTFVRDAATSGERDLP